MGPELVPGAPARRRDLLRQALRPGEHLLVRRREVLEVEAAEDLTVRARAGAVGNGRGQVEVGDGARGRDAAEHLRVVRRRRPRPSREGRGRREPRGAAEHVAVGRSRLRRQRGRGRIRRLPPVAPLPVGPPRWRRCGDLVHGRRLRRGEGRQAGRAGEESSAAPPSTGLVIQFQIRLV